MVLAYVCEMLALDKVDYCYFWFADVLDVLLACWLNSDLSAGVFDALSAAVLDGFGGFYLRR